MPTELKKRIPGEAEVRDGDHGLTLILLEITGVQEGERRWKKREAVQKGTFIVGWERRFVSKD